MCQSAPEKVTKHEGIKKIARGFIPMALYRRLRPYYFRVFGWGYRPAETTKARPRRLREGFFEKYCQGKGLDVGFGGDPLTPDCRCFDYEHGDAQYIKSIKDNSFDFVYTSHVIEHMVDPAISLKNWWRAVKPGGYLLLYLPHRDLYEKKKTLPSLYNPDHKHFFLLEQDEDPVTLGIVPLIKKTLPGAEIIYAKECAEGHTITDPLIHSDGEYSIEVVIKKPK